jgi:hypothetical protein
MIRIVGESNNKYGRHDIRNLQILFNLRRLAFNFLIWCRRRRKRPEEVVISREEGWRLYLEKLEVKPSGDST